jgi:hypothetical protein
LSYLSLKKKRFHTFNKQCQLFPVTLYWSVCTKQGRWTAMYMRKGYLSCLCIYDVIIINYFLLSYLSLKKKRFHTFNKQWVLNLTIHFNLTKFKDSPLSLVPFIINHHISLLKCILSLAYIWRNMVSALFNKTNMHMPTSVSRRLYPMYIVQELGACHSNAARPVIYEHRHFTQMHDRIMLLRVKDWIYKTSFSPSLFIEVSAPSKEGERPCIWILVLLKRADTIFRHLYASDRIHFNMMLISSEIFVKIRLENSWYTNWIR